MISIMKIDIFSIFQGALLLKSSFFCGFGLNYDIIIMTHVLISN